MVLLLLGALAGADAWIDRAALAADRLAVAAVDENAQSRPLKDLWWSGEGQQVLELMDHKACLGRLAQGCLFGTGMHPKADQAPTRITQGRKRWQFSNDRHQVLALEVVGTDAVFWVWRERPFQAAVALPPLQASSPAVSTAPSSPEPAPNPSPWWLVLVPAVFLIGRHWGSKSRVQHFVELQTQDVEGELEAERLRFAVERRAALQERDQLRSALTHAKEQPPPQEQARIADLERALDRIQKRWIHLRNELDREADVSRRDATRFLAPLQQFGAMLRQVERRMRTVDEIGYAQKIQQRRIGLQGFEERLRLHFESSSSFDARSWQAARDELDELLSVTPKPASSTAETNTQLQVLSGGR